MNQYREGKVKRTPVRGVKEYLKPYTYKQWEGYGEPCVESSKFESLKLKSKRMSTDRYCKLTLNFSTLRFEL